MAPNATETLGTGETYTTIQAWEDDLDANDQYTGECKAEVFSNVFWVSENYTTTEYPHLTAQSGAEHDGRAHEVSAAGNARVEWVAVTSGMYVADPNIRISWLEIKGPGDNSSHGIQILSASAEFYCHHNIIHNNHARNGVGNYGIYLNDDVALIKAYRNIIYGCGGSGIFPDLCAANTAILHNTTYENVHSGTAGMGGIQTDDVDAIINGNACFDNDQADIEGVAGTLDYNGTSDTTGDDEGANGIANLVTADQFVNPTDTWANTDLLLKAGADLVDEGTSFNPATYPEIDVSIDKGATRATIDGTWDIGASELVAALDDVTVLPGAQGLTVSVLAPTVRIDKTATPATLALTGAILAPVAVVKAVIVIVALTLSVLAPTIVGDVTVTPDALSLTGSVLAPTVNTTLEPSTLALTSSVLAPAIVIDATPEPSTLTLTASVLASTVGPVIEPSTLALTVSVLAPSVIIDVTLTPATLGLTSSILSPIPSVYNVPGVLGLTSSVLAPTIVIDATPTPSTLALTSSVLSPIPSVTVLPSTLSLTSSILAPTIVGDATVTPPTLTLTLSLPAVTITGPVSRMIEINRSENKIKTGSDVYLGDLGVSDYTKIDSKGSVSISGTARTINGLWIDAGGIKAPGLKPAIIAAHGLLETPAWAFANIVAEANEQTVSWSVRVPNRMDRSVAPTIAVGWSADAESPGVCEWQLEYLWTAVSEDTGGVAQETLYADDTAPATADGLVVTIFTGIDAPGETDACLHCRLKRLSTASAGSQTDTIAIDVHLHGVCLNFTSNKLGAATE